ncbi:unnamed protein product, partial [Gongylonema pulchrum]|uniref:G_PROTEIN_RECEP_F1_2 domain-containing protein n=1 Tax=Gongylonema pulchrum TaxID=637853 RepID=A0A183D6X3_9BILA
VLFVLPSSVQAVYGITNQPNASIISEFAIFLSYLNAFNMVIIFICRQRDARSAVIAAWRKMRKKHKDSVKILVSTADISRQPTLRAQKQTFQTLREKRKSTPF